MIDPEQLDKEADELLQQQQNGTLAGQEPETLPTDTDNNEPTPPPKSENSESDMVSAERYKNAEARMHQALEETAALRKEVEALKQQVNIPNEQQALEKDTPDDLEGLMEDYPEIVTPLVNKLRAMEKLLGDVKTSNDSIQKASAQTEQNSHLEAVKSVHADVVEIANSTDFQGWAERQSNVVKQAISNGSVQDVIYVLDQYKQQMGLSNSPDNAPSKLEQAKNVATPRVGSQVTPTSNAPKQFTRESIAAMSPEVFAKNEAAIDKAMAQGLIA